MKYRSLAFAALIGGLALTPAYAEKPNKQTPTKEDKTPKTCVTELVDKNFDAVVQNMEMPVFVDFYAHWCGPCKRIAPTLDKVSCQYSNSVAFVRIDASKNPKTKKKYGIKGFPTLRMYDGKKEYEISRRKPTEANLKKRIDSVLAQIEKDKKKNAPQEAKPSEKPAEPEPNF